MKPQDKPHYVNNRDFSYAVVDYVTILNEARDAGNELPIVPDYIASCFLKIAEGLSHKSNFIRYTYREEMVMDAVENCLKAIENYNLEAATRTGKPNAFAYFTQITYYAFLRRIAKEKKQQEIKDSYFESSFASDLIEAAPDQDASSAYVAYAAIETAKRRMNENDELTDDEYFDTMGDTLPKKRIRKTNDSDVTDFL